MINQRSTSKTCRPKEPRDGVTCNACSIPVFDLTHRNCKINFIDLVPPVIRTERRKLGLYSNRRTHSINTLFDADFFETRLPTSLDPLESKRSSVAAFSVVRIIHNIISNTIVAALIIRTPLLRTLFFVLVLEYLTN